MVLLARGLGRFIRRLWKGAVLYDGRAVVSTCQDMAWSGRGGEGIRVACFEGQAVMDEVHAHVVHAWASDGSAPRRGRGKSLMGELEG